MSNALTTEQIETAVEWWAKDLQGPTFDQLSAAERKQDPKARNREGLAAMLIALGRREVTENQIEAFRGCLREILESPSGVDVGGGRFIHPRNCGLNVDYGPEMGLRQALQQANISNATLSIKTYMQFRDGGVQVSHGYGAAWVELLPVAQSEEKGNE